MSPDHWTAKNLARPKLSTRGVFKLGLASLLQSACSNEQPAVGGPLHYITPTLSPSPSATPDMTGDLRFYLRGKDGNQSLLEQKGFEWNAHYLGEDIMATLTPWTSVLFVRHSPIVIRETYLGDFAVLKPQGMRVTHLIHTKSAAEALRWVGADKRNGDWEIVCLDQIKYNNGQKHGYERHLNLSIPLESLPVAL